MSRESKENLIKSFDEALEALNSQIGDGEGGEEENLNKSSDTTATNTEKQPKAEKKEADVTDEEEDDEEDEEEFGKSIEDELSGDEEAEAAMDVEPFLRGLVKSFDERLNALTKSFQKRIGELEELTKSQSRMIAQQAELQKSLYEDVEQIGQQPVPSSSVTRLNKSRFGEGEEQQEYTGQQILEKSRQWLNEGKIDLQQATMIEGRVNKGTLNKSGDKLDNTVQQLLKSNS